MPQLPALRALIADDNVVGAKIAKLTLAQMGIRADVVGNGEEVLEAVARQPYDVVLMDIEMPLKDGLDTTRAIVARWPAEARPYIIGLSAHAMAVHRDSAFAAGMDDYLEKPLNRRRLIEALAKVPSRRSPAIDLDVIRRLTEALGAAGAADIVDTFRKEAPGLIERLQAAIHAKDPAALHAAAHALKGAARSCGLMHIGVLCEELEVSASDTDWIAAEARGGAVAADWEAVRPALELAA